MTLSAKTAAVLQALRDNTEGSPFNGFCDVYLDNAFAGLGLSRHAFAGHLAALKEAGLYKSYGDDCFGRVVPAELAPEAPAAAPVTSPALARVWARKARLEGGQ